MANQPATTTSGADEGCGTTCSCLATVAARDLQPLVAELRGYLGALARSDGPAGRRLIAAAQASTDRMEVVLDALAVYEVTDRVAERRRVAVASILAAAEDVLADQFTRHDVRLKVGPMPELAADPQQLYHALLVLLRHAAHAAPPHAVLTLRALRREPEWQLRLGVEPDDVSTSGTVGANQDGIAPRGIELLTVQRAAQAHGGRVWCEDARLGRSAVRFSIRDPSR